jgi:hypothetical protein
MEGWDKARADTVWTVGVVVDFQGIASRLGMGFAHAPVGARVIAVGDGA